MIIQENEYKLYLYGFQLKCVLSYYLSLVIMF